MVPAARKPTASAHASGRRHMRPNTWGFGGSMSSSTDAERARTSITIHGMIASAANAAHMPSENRQLDASATGTATSGGVNDATAIVVE